MKEKTVLILITDSEHEELVVRALEKFGVDEWTKTDYIEVHNINAVTYMFLATKETYDDVLNYIKEEEPIVKDLMMIKD